MQALGQPYRMIARGINTSRSQSRRPYSAIQKYTPPNTNFEDPFAYMLTVEKRINTSRQSNDVNAKIQGVFFNSLLHMVHGGFKVDQPIPESQKHPLHTAISKDCGLTAEALVKLGASVNKYNKAEETPLFVAAFFDRVSVAKMLIDRGADVMKRSFTQSGHFEQPYRLSLPFHVASSPTMLEMLLEKGTPVNAISDSEVSYTALHFNTVCMKVDAVRYLLENQAIDFPNIKGHSALQIARQLHVKYKAMPGADYAVWKLEEIISMLAHHHASRKNH